MPDPAFELDVLSDLLKEGSAVGQLAKTERTFVTSYEAFRSEDRKAFQALEHAREAQAFKSSTAQFDGRLFRALNPPASSRQPVSTGTITWTPAN